MSHPTVLDDLLCEVADDVRRDREAQPRGRAADGAHGGEGGNADDLRVEVDQRTAAVARIDRRAGLDGLAEGGPGEPGLRLRRLGDGAAERGHDPLRHAALQPERAAHRQDDLTDPQFPHVAEPRGHQPARVLHPDHGEVLHRVRVHERGLPHRAAVGQSDLERRRGPDDVGVSDDVPWRSKTTPDPTDPS